MTIAPNSKPNPADPLSNPSPTPNLVPPDAPCEPLPNEPPVVQTPGAPTPVHPPLDRIIRSGHPSPLSAIVKARFLQPPTFTMGYWAPQPCLTGFCGKAGTLVEE